MKIANIISHAVAIWCLLLFACGLAVFPDAPYQPCDSGDGYCGKSGHAHSRTQYESERRWENAIIYSAPFGILGAIFAVRRYKTGRNTK
jgi:hypothetical protein